MILVTGATGFVGRALITSLLDNQTQVNAIVRQKTPELPVEVKQYEVADLGDLSSTETQEVIKNSLQNVEVVIHTAARVHMMQDASVDPLLDFRKVNRDATLTLANMAVDSGVKRFVFISSIKVNGEATSAGNPFLPDDEHVPSDAYGLSKYEAEQGLLELSKQTGLEVVIIRPPLVYGAGVRANFASMMKWMNRSIPLPFGAIHNQRSLVALDNLVDFIALCANRKKSPQAANQVFLISDGEDVSTTQLLRKVATSLNKRAWLIPIPVSFMTWGAKLLGKAEVANRLFGSLQVDSAKARDLLGWKPVTTMDEQLKKTAKYYLKLMRK